VASAWISSQSIIWFGVAALLLGAPGLLSSLLFNGVLNATGLVVSRLFGAELLGLALVSWITRDGGWHPRALYASYFACNAAGFVVSAGAGAAGLLTPIGWILVPLYLAYATAFAVLWARSRPRVTAGTCA
jgi:hypothetical protein